MQHARFSSAVVCPKIADEWLVTLAALEGHSPLMLAAVLDIFAEVGRHVGPDRIRVKLQNPRDLPGIDLCATERLEQKPIRPSTRKEVAALLGCPPQKKMLRLELLEKLRSLAKSGGIILAGGDAVELLAEAGLLVGRRYTVHWMRAGDFSLHWPGLSQPSDALYVVDGPIATCAGGTAFIDMLLFLLSTWLPISATDAVLRNLGIAGPRSPNVPQRKASCVRSPTGHPLLNKALAHLLLHFGKEDALQSLPGTIGISQRHIERLFQQELGKTPLRHLNDLRLDHARGLLTETGLALTEVARLSGFSSAERLSSLHRNKFGHSPTYAF